MYSFKLANGAEIKDLKWHMGRFWTDKDYRSELTPEQLAVVEVITDEEPVIDYEDERFTGDFFMPGVYKDMAYYDYRKRKGEHGLWAFYIAARREE